MSRVKDKCENIIQDSTDVMMLTKLRDQVRIMNNALLTKQQKVLESMRRSNFINYDSVSSEEIEERVKNEDPSN